MKRHPLLALFLAAFFGALLGAALLDPLPRSHAAASTSPSTQPRLNLAALTSPILFRGDARTAYRDPAALYHDGTFHLFFTLVRQEDDHLIYSYTAHSQSTDLLTWTPPKILTPRDRSLNFCSPGSILRFQDSWVLCVSSYPRPNGEKYGNQDARLWILRSKDLATWSDPELLRVKGPDVPREKMGRMIDPYLFPDAHDPAKIWCYYKQNGLSSAWSRDLVTWTPAGRIAAGENPCIIRDGDEYVLFHSPPNGIGLKRSRDLVTWKDSGLLTLGQADWPWARGRLTAGFALDLRQDPAVGQCLLFFHASGPEDERTYFDNFASLALAWSPDLAHWTWPGQKPSTSQPAATAAHP